jgi:transcriptional regulator with XRE-family HTH domain
MVDNDRLHVLVGERIRLLREAQSPKMSQQELAEILGLKRTSVTNIEQGNQKPTLETLYRICDHFGVEIGEVMPRLVEVLATKIEPTARAVVIGGRSQEIGAKTATVIDRLRPSSRTRR